MFENYSIIENFVHTAIRKSKVLVVGDVMLDRYYFGEVKRISPEAPVPVTRVLAEKEVLGGAANVVHNLALLGCQVSLVGIAGDDDNWVRLANMLNAIGVNAEGLVIDNRPTTTKLRVIGGHQQMMRLDFEEVKPISQAADKKIRKQIDQAIAAGVTCIVISDYAKGLCTTSLCQYIIRTANKNNIPVIVDPKGDKWVKYNDAFLLTPNLKEISQVVHKQLKNTNQEIKTAADKVRRRFRLSGIIVTRSEKGLTLVNGEQEVHIPTRAQEVFDVSGAGDTVIAVLGAALAGRVPLADAAQLANLAAGVVVAKLGTYAINQAELIGAVKRFQYQEE